MRCSPAGILYAGVFMKISDRAIAIGYVMSRLDRLFLAELEFASWSQAFREIADVVQVKPTSVKNLRDEFDLLHPHRVGHKKPLPPSRQRVLRELVESSDESLLRLAAEYLQRSPMTTSSAPGAIRDTTAAAAARFETGIRAEEFFLEHSQAICGIPPDDLVDARYDASGFDFATRSDARVAIEVKGLAARAGSLTFSDREWKTAGERQQYYWLVVVGGLRTEGLPIVEMIKNPSASLAIEETVTRSRAWTTKITIA
jgi:hypothetical protein